MKSIIFLSSFFAMMLLLCSAIKPAKAVKANEINADTINPQSYFIDIHNLEPGKVTFDDVMKAHQKDLATQDKYNAKFLKFWVDEKQGKVYCLSKANDSASVKQTHKEAHGLMPSIIYDVTEGQEAIAGNNNHFFIDVHEMGAGKVTANDVAVAHAKDLQVQNNIT